MNTYHTMIKYGMMWVNELTLVVWSTPQSLPSGILNDWLGLLS